MQASADAWVDLVKTLLIPGGLGVAVVAYLSGNRKGPGTAKAIEGTVVSAAFADGQALRDLTDAIKRLTTETCDNREQMHRDSIAERDSRDELRGTVRDLMDMVRRGGMQPTPPDWDGLIDTLSKRKEK